jgi:LysM repeat protein
VTDSPVDGATPDGTRAWPVQCPVDQRWLTEGDTCPDCGSPLAPVRALNELAGTLLDEAATSADPDTAARLVSQAATLVPSTEHFEVAAADALERAGRPDLALGRVEAAMRIAPRRADLQERAAALRGRRVTGRPQRSMAASRGRLAIAAVVLLALGVAGGGLLDRSIAQPIEQGSTALPTPVAFATAGPATQSPSPAATPAALATPAPTSGASPTATFEPARLVRTALAADRRLSSASLAVEQVGSTVRVSGPVADATALARLQALLRRVSPSVDVDLSGVTFPSPRYVYVQRGDTLWSIAARTYGNPRRWRAIAAANPSIDPSRIQPGQRLVLPDVPRRSQAGG